MLWLWGLNFTTPSVQSVIFIFVTTVFIRLFLFIISLQTSLTSRKLVITQWQGFGQSCSLFHSRKKREKYGHLWKKLFKILKLHFHYPVQRQLFHSPVAATAMVLRLPRCVVDLVLIILILYDKVWRERGCKVGPWHLWHAQSRHSWTHQVDNYSAMHFKVNWQSWNKTNKCTENSR